MHETSALWKQILAEPDHRKQHKAIINGNEYDESRIIRASVTGQLFDALSVGNCFSRTLDLTVMPLPSANGAIPPLSEIKLFTRLVSADGLRVSEEYIQKGVFYADEVKKDSDTDAVTIKAFDAMMKMNLPFGASASGGGGGGSGDTSRAYTISFADTFGHVEKFLRRAGDAMPTPTTPTREGERFLAWNPDPADTSTVTGDAHFRARWTPKYLVTFDDGSGTPQKFTCFEGDATPTPDTPTKSGYVFTAWTPTPKPTVTRRITYAAQWQAVIDGIASIAITTYPVKSDYAVWETLDYTGLTVTAIMHDGTERDITSDCSQWPQDGMTVTEIGDILVDVRYGADSIGTFWVAVSDAKITANHGVPD